MGARGWGPDNANTLFTLFCIFTFYVYFIWCLYLVYLIDWCFLVSSKTSQLQLVTLCLCKETFSICIIYKMFFLSLVVVFLVLIIFTKSREQNNVLRYSLFILMAQL